MRRKYITSEHHCIMIPEDKEVRNMYYHNKEWALQKERGQGPHFCDECRHMQTNLLSNMHVIRTTTKCCIP